jgi:hypothetical protein
VVATAENGQIDSLAMKIRDPKARSDIEDNLRKTVGQAIGGAAVLIGAGSALFQFLIAATSDRPGPHGTR